MLPSTHLVACYSPVLPSYPHPTPNYHHLIAHCGTGRGDDRQTLQVSRGWTASAPQVRAPFGHLPVPRGARPHLEGKGPCRGDAASSQAPTTYLFWAFCDSHGGVKNQKQCQQCANRCFLYIHMCTYTYIPDVALKLLAVFCLKASVLSWGTCKNKAMIHITGRYHHRNLLSCSCSDSVPCKHIKLRSKFAPSKWIPASPLAAYLWLFNIPNLGIGRNKE